MNDTLSGGSGRDYLNGETGRDRLQGAAGNDRLTGRAGTDTLLGGAGADILNGGTEADILFGGAGSDIFQFAFRRASPPGDADTIRDFRTGHDFMDMSPLNLKFIGRRAFHGDDQIRWEYRGRETHVTADLNGDGRADLRIILNGRIALTSDDFLL